MREHMGLYRGKRVDTGEWIEGFYFREAGHFIKELPSATSTPTHLVFPNTVGECTGLRDKNGNLIFEGDIVCLDDTTNELWVFDFGNCGGVQNVAHEVGYNGFHLRPLSDVAIRVRNFGQRDDPVYYLNAFRLRIIGNIHDNPELLKGGEGE